MASLKEDNINFDKLAAGADQAVAAEDLYWLQNDAKFRAVKQKGTYDEFKEIVAAAHLKPLDKKDKLQITDDQPTGPWNPILTKNSNVTIRESNQTTSANEDSQSSLLPSTANNFIRVWRSIKNADDKLCYLKRFTADRLSNLFKREIPLGLLGEFILVLHSDNESLDASWTHNVLEKLALTGRFNITLSFLTDSERQALSSLLLLLVQAGIDISKVKTNYNIDVI